MWALGSWYVTCLKCLYAYRLRRELSAAAGWCRLGGRKAEVSRWSIWAYIARCNAILSRNQLLGHAWWFEIQLPESLHGGMIYLELGQKCVNRNGFLSSDIWSSFKRNLDIPLYITPTVYSSCKIIQNGSLLVAIHVLMIFIGQNLQVSLWKKIIWEITY